MNYTPPTANSWGTTIRTLTKLSQRQGGWLVAGICWHHCSAKLKTKRNSAGGVPSFVSKQNRNSAWGPREIGVLAFVILVLGSYAIWQRPKFVTGSPLSQARTCVNNLFQIDAAASQFALEEHLTNGDRIIFPDDLTPYIKLNGAGKIPSCPAGGIYHIETVGEIPTCSLGTSVTPAHSLPPRISSPAK